MELILQNERGERLSEVTRTNLLRHTSHKTHSKEGAESAEELSRALA